MREEGGQTLKTEMPNSSFPNLTIFFPFSVLSLHAQRRRQHFKSGQATADKRSLVHVHERVGGGGGGGVYNSKNYSSVAVKTTCGIKMQLCNKRYVHNVAFQLDCRFRNGQVVEAYCGDSPPDGGESPQ